ncbi:MAG: hypothetical protein ACM3N6_12480 [Betaproteobacteria bacterium]
MKTRMLEESYDNLESARVQQGSTLGLVQPSRLLGMDIFPVDNPDWTEDEKVKLKAAAGQLVRCVRGQRSLNSEEASMPSPD